MKLRISFVILLAGLFVFPLAEPTQAVGFAESQMILDFNSLSVSGDIYYRPGWEMTYTFANADDLEQFTSGTAIINHPLFSWDPSLAEVTSPSGNAKGAGFTGDNPYQEGLSDNIGAYSRAYPLPGAWGSSVGSANRSFRVIANTDTVLTVSIDYYYFGQAGTESAGDSELTHVGASIGFVNFGPLQSEDYTSISDYLHINGWVDANEFSGQGTLTLSMNLMALDEVSVGIGANSVSYVYSAGGAPVPIPAAAWLFGSGLLGLAGLRRRFFK